MRVAGAPADPVYQVGSKEEELHEHPHGRAAVSARVTAVTLLLWRHLSTPFRLLQRDTHSQREHDHSSSSPAYPADPPHCFWPFLLAAAPSPLSDFLVLSFPSSCAPEENGQTGLQGIRTRDAEQSAPASYIKFLGTRHWERMLFARTHYAPVLPLDSNPHTRPAPPRQLFPALLAK